MLIMLTMVNIPPAMLKPSAEHQKTPWLHLFRYCAPTLWGREGTVRGGRILRPPGDVLPRDELLCCGGDRRARRRRGEPSFGRGLPVLRFFRARIPGAVLPGVADLCSYKNGNPLEVPRRGARACGGDPPSVNSLGRGRAGVHALDVQGLRQCPIGRALLGGSTPCNLAGHSCRVAPIEDRGIRL